MESRAGGRDVAQSGRRMPGPRRGHSAGTRRQYPAIIGRRTEFRVYGRRPPAHLRHGRGLCQGAAAERHHRHAQTFSGQRSGLLPPHRQQHHRRTDLARGLSAPVGADDRRSRLSRHHDGQQPDQRPALPDEQAAHRRHTPPGVRLQGGGHDRLAEYGLLSAAAASGAHVGRNAAHARKRSVPGIRPGAKPPVPRSAGPKWRRCWSG